MTLRLLRGRVAVRELEMDRSVLWFPEPSQRKVKIHRGLVLDAGPPRLTSGGVEAPRAFEIGDEVLFVFVHHRDAWTFTWSDGRPFVYLPEMCLQAVLERGPTGAPS